MTDDLTPNQIKQVLDRIGIRVVVFASSGRLQVEVALTDRSTGEPFAENKDDCSLHGFQAVRLR